jgi:hypothetical protein
MASNQNQTESIYLGVREAQRGIFVVDFMKLTKLLLPTFLRKPLLFSFLKAGVVPIAAIHQQLLTFRNEKINQMSYNSQVCYLRKMLNDKFDPYQRRIQLGNATQRPPLWIYKEIEDKPVFLGTVMINRANTISTSSEFVVYIPISLRDKVNGISAWLDYYKLTTKFYTIKYI